MTSLIENHNGVTVALQGSPRDDGFRPPTFSSPVFLMVNSLETGGTERQFMEVARALRADRIPLHLGCIKKEGAFVGDANEVEEFRIPAVIGSHRQIGDLLTPAQFSAQLAAFKMCDRVVCNSRAAAERLLQAGLPERKIAVLGNALPAEAFAQVAPALPYADGTMRVGMIARMNAAYKNHRGFLRVAARLSARFPNVKFVLVGDGPMRSELEQQAAELGIANRVQFLGNRRDVWAVLASLDVSVVPSDSESLSNVMLESMAAGVPVVATLVGGNTELGDEGRAMLVKAGQEQALDEGIARVLEDKAWRSAMALKAQAFVQANFSVERICGQYEELYADALREKPEHAAGRRQTGARQPVGSKIRVAFVAPTLRYVGGQAVQADLLMRSWKSDPEVEASFVAVDPRFPFGLRWVERVPLLRTVLRLPLYAWKLWRGLKDVDVAHIFSASYSSFLLAPLPAWLIARIRNKQIVINYRSGEARDHLERSWIARRILKNADRLVVPSGYLVDVFREFGLEAQAVANIVDLSQFRYRLRRPLKPHLICTRGFHPYYRIDVLVRAFAEVQRIYPEAQLDLVGSGALEGSIRELVTGLQLCGVKFAGVASRREIGGLYDRADIFVNASNLDNMPVSVLEAFAAGTPVVSTAPDGMKYIVTHEHTGLLSSPGDSSALAQNILRTLKEPDLAERLARNAFEELHRYCWEAVRGQWLGVYAALVSQTEKKQ